MSTYIGWDVGGAHLKAVWLNRNGKVLAAKQIYCPLWQGLEYLETAVQEIMASWRADCHAVTMTGELADIFVSRQQGVSQIVVLLSNLLQGDVRYYAGKLGLIATNDAIASWTEVASMNWLASVQLTAAHISNAIFVDIGSTTTDIVLIRDGAPSMQGLTDAARMQCDELIYTGVVRTPLMAVAQRIMVGDALSHVAAEYFATTADVYTLIGDLAVEDYSGATADGADKSMPSCARRIARMVGYDFNDVAIDDWKKLALEFKQHQLDQIKTAIQRHLAMFNNSHEFHIVGAGAGSFLVQTIAQQLQRPYQTVQEFIAADNAEISKKAAVCFPAYAAGFLALSAD
jgi:probable H4MPT-linked C1 transfer pathway protein